jgi:hypothetical protein
MPKVPTLNLLDPYQYQRLFFPRSTKAIKTYHNRLDWDAHVAEKLGNGTFKTRYRMSIESFNTLVGMLDITVDCAQSKRSTSGNSPIIPELVVAISIRYLSGDPKCVIADFFGVSDSSVDRCIDIFLDKVMACERLHIKMPTTPQELRRAANGFTSISTTSIKIFDGCVGAIDGWLVEITQPSREEVPNTGDYFSGHYNCFGLNVIAACDHRLRFTYMSVAAPGRTNDNRSIRRLEELQDWIDDLPSQYFLVADNAFSLTNKMLVPFSGAQRSEPNKRVFNYFHSQLRIRIEMSFGLMTTKWRIFRVPLATSLAKARKIIAVTMMLHNFVIENDGFRVNNLRTTTRQQFGVDSLPSRTGLDAENNGFMPIVNQVHVIPSPDASRRDMILQNVIVNGLRRPRDNIARNG